MKKALIMIDLQNDFCPGGSLAVPEGDQVIPLANALQPQFDWVIATQDWHPKAHTSFASNHPGHKVGEVVMVEGLPQILWPNHCVQHTQGAEFHPQLDTHKITKIFQKGINKHIDSYSAFFDNAHQRSTGLNDFLREKGIEEVYMIGLATDYCVKYSVLDAVQLGFHVYVIEDACRGVELKSGDSMRAIEEMKIAGAKMIRSKDLLR